MDLDAARRFIESNHRAILATRKSDGSIRMSPVIVAIDDGGRAIISSRETAYKVKNIRRSPEISLCVINDGFFGDWIQIDGRAEIVSLPDAMDLLIDYYRRLQGDHPDWDDYRAAMERERRVMVRVTIDDAGPDRSG